MEACIFSSEAPFAPSRRVAILDEILGKPSYAAFRFPARSLRELVSPYLASPTARFAAAVEKWEKDEEEGFFICVEAAIRSSTSVGMLMVGISLGGDLTDMFFERPTGNVEILRSEELEHLAGHIANALFDDLEATANQREPIPLSEIEKKGYFASPVLAR